MNNAKLQLPVCIILAAGYSKRLGRPKALLEIKGEYLINNIVKKLRKHDLEILIITNKELFDQINRSTKDAEIIINPRPEMGRTGSLQVGLRHLKDNFSKNFKTIVVPIDRPGFSNATISKLISLNSTSSPMKNGKGGHPILLSAVDISKILCAEPNIPLRDIIAPTRFEVNDNYLHLNIDTEDDVKLLLDYYIQDESNF